MKNIIIKLKNQGYKFSQIAEELNIPISSVKSIYYRNNEKDANIQKTKCVECRQELDFSKKTKNKKFCSNSCRYKYWCKNNTDTDKTCANCNKKFESFKKNQKFCSHLCYLDWRYNNEKD